MEPIRVVIVDDEELARRILAEHVRELPDAAIIAECANGFDAVKTINELRPDLVFLDIQMPKLSGFEVLDLLDGAPAVIFVTAHDEFAVRAFEADAVDYLLKPFSGERFQKAWTRAMTRRSDTTIRHTRDVASKIARSAGPLERILVRDGGNVTIIPVGAVDFVEAQDDYVAIHAGGRKHLKQQPLSELETLLDPRRFVRVHRSYIVNIDRFARIELYAKDSRILILRDGTRVPMSRSGHDRVRTLLNP